MKRIASVAVASVLLFSAAGVAQAATPQPAPTPASQPVTMASAAVGAPTEVWTKSDANTKRYTLRVSGCSGCRVQAAGMYSGLTPTKRVRRGRVTLWLVPGSSVYFTIDDRNRQNWWYATAIAIRYKGLKTGQRVRKSDFKRKMRATQFWKVPGKSTTRSVRVDDVGRWWDDVSEKWIYKYRAYMVVTQPKSGRYYSAPRGEASNQGFS